MHRTGAQDLANYPFSQILAVTTRRERQRKRQKERERERQRQTDRGESQSAALTVLIADSSKEFHGSCFCG